MCATWLLAAVLMHAAPVRFVCRYLQVPFICDLKPSGKYVMEDMHKVTTTLGLGTGQVGSQAGFGFTSSLVSGRS